MRNIFALYIIATVTLVGGGFLLQGNHALFYGLGTAVITQPGKQALASCEEGEVEVSPGVTFLDGACTVQFYKAGSRG